MIARRHVAAALFVVLGIPSSSAFGQETSGTVAKTQEKAQEATGHEVTGNDGMRAYLEALQRRRLAEAKGLRRVDLERIVADAEALASQGRDAEVIAELTETVEHPDFALLGNSTEGYAALDLLGQALARSGIHDLARAYLRKALSQKGIWDKNAPYARRAVRKLAEIALETRNYDAGLSDLKDLPPNAPAEVRAERSYVVGRAKEAAGDVSGALASYAEVPQTSRFWSQATYLSGLIEVERGRMREGENLFCKVADPKRQDKTAPVFADERFFAVRDLARLALGRVAHEQYRFDDARYYYYLVPQDSDRLAEALYESATSRYEKKDYDGAHDLIRELSALGMHHRYEDEVQILDAYVELGRCRFAEADAKLNRFLSTYTPVRDAARRLERDPEGMRVLLDAARRGTDAGSNGSVGASITPEQLRTVAALVRVDPSYGEIASKRAVVEREMRGLRTSLDTIADMQRSLSTEGSAKEGSVRPAVELRDLGEDKAQRAREAIAGVRRQLEDLEVAKVPASTLAPLRTELANLEARIGAETARPKIDASNDVGAAKGMDLPELFAKDAARGRALLGQLDAVRNELGHAETVLARDALHRFDLRLSRLLRRARLGRIESVLGKKRALEVEVEALQAGFLPREALDSLDAVHVLRDDEEYWPFEGDDWPDEFVGTEGLK